MIPLPYVQLTWQTHPWQTVLMPGLGLACAKTWDSVHSQAHSHIPVLLCVPVSQLRPPSVTTLGLTFRHPLQTLPMANCPPPPLFPHLYTCLPPNGAVDIALVHQKPLLTWGQRGSRSGVGGCKKYPILEQVASTIFSMERWGVV